MAFYLHMICQTVNLILILEPHSPDVIPRKLWGILILIQFSSQFPISIFLMKAVRNTILNFVLYASFLIMEPISASLQIFQKKIFLWKKSKSYIECVGARRQVFVSSNIRLVWSTGTAVNMKVF